MPVTKKLYTPVPKVRYGAVSIGPGTRVRTLEVGPTRSRVGVRIFATSSPARADNSRAEVGSSVSLHLSDVPWCVRHLAAEAERIGHPVTGRVDWEWSCELSSSPHLSHLTDRQWIDRLGREAEIRAHVDVNGIVTHGEFPVIPEDSGRKPGRAVVRARDEDGARRRFDIKARKARQPGAPIPVWDEQPHIGISVVRPPGSRWTVYVPVGSIPSLIDALRSAHAALYAEAENPTKRKATR